MKIIESLQHQIYAGAGSLDMLSDLIKKYDENQIVIICDENTFRHCFPLFTVIKNGRTIVIPAGEQYKNLATATTIWEQLLAFNIDRNGLIMNLGGGVVGDMGGFCASVWKRGIDFLQIPTTLLAMVDASCGGKTGIDFQNIKNQIGTFDMPVAVVVDPIFLNTLPKREFLSGVAEMIKHAIISGSETHLQQFENIENFTVENITPLIVKSIEIKNEIVLQDPYEKNIRKALNFGHTIGHALETLSWQTPLPLLHGEAVLLGMKYETKLAYNKGLISKTIFERYGHLFQNFFYNDNIIALISMEQLWTMIQHDKKKNGQNIFFSLPLGDGLFTIDNSVDFHEIKAIFSEK